MYIALMMSNATRTLVPIVLLLVLAGCQFMAAAYESELDGLRQLRRGEKIEVHMHMLRGTQP